MEKNNFLLTVITVIVLGIVAVAGIVFSEIKVEKMIKPQLGGLVHNVQEIFTAGIKAGISETEVINSSGQFVYQVNGTTISGTTGTFSGTLGVTGVTTLSDQLKVSRTTLSTVQVGSIASGVGTGCLVLGDSGGATSTPVYITATGGTISASTTKPAICQ